VCGLQLITNNGRSVHPNAVSIREQDPLATSDWFQEGVHYVPETEEFLSDLGHFRDSDADLIWRRCVSWDPFGICQLLRGGVSYLQLQASLAILLAFVLGLLHQDEQDGW
jgi:hypothetical protein